jgi:hypothetical protein
MTIDLLQSTAPTANPIVSGTKRKRVKIFTVHGTFDTEAGWDDWNLDSKRPDGSYALFINRLRQELGDRQIEIEKEDHT